MEQVILHLEDLERTLSGAGGALYFSVGNDYFPGEKWREPVSADLEYWVPPLVSFAHGHMDMCRLIFMDGPYVVKLHREKNGAVFASFFRDTQADFRTEICLRELIRSLIRCLRTYDRAMHEWGLATRWVKETAVLNYILKQD